jgi:hypothetical protein
MLRVVMLDKMGLGQIMKTIYIAGPMRGISRFNFDAFDRARDQLIAEGWTVISPADLDREHGFDVDGLGDDEADWWRPESLGFDLAAAIDRCLDAIAQCDAVYVLPGWRDSRGASAEVAVAKWRGLEIVFAPDR